MRRAFRAAARRAIPAITDDAPVAEDDAADEVASMMDPDQGGLDGMPGVSTRTVSRAAATTTARGHRTTWGEHPCGRRFFDDSWRNCGKFVMGRGKVIKAGARPARHDRRLRDARHSPELAYVTARWAVSSANSELAGGATAGGGRGGPGRRALPGGHRHATRSPSPTNSSSSSPSGSSHSWFRKRLQ